MTTRGLPPPPPHFAHLEDRIEIAHFPETLDPHDPEQHAALITRLHSFDGILAMRERTPFKKETLTALPNLKLLLTTGTRNLALDTAYCAERGIPVAGTASRSSSGGVDSAAQHAWALILALARHVARDDAALKRGEGLAGVTGRDVGPGRRWAWWAWESSGSRLVALRSWGDRGAPGSGVPVAQGQLPCDHG
ncbi:D-isomer specific 2-hydroxyacid dehydrogenase family protein [Aspergillus rambellii]|uniref:D-isomer specific 2-hydroxyacid dehydrogenase family protein n=1 Tax=Aspergillus rambellii TaxID=308745 RepID=A0A0F8V150_9EURO|nr:D-isomer specific 2-hydroxyacid dehydrogenase family protein [Aspergillus rambellii]